MNANEFLSRTNEVGIVGKWEYQSIRPYVICEDGFTFSMQASDIHYCTPRENFAPYYSKVELGFPSEQDELIMEYAEDLHSPCKTVYGWVPIETVDELIIKHGGIVNEDLD